MKFILGKKIEMTQVFKEDGTVIPVTAVLAMPNVVTQIKTNDKEKYNSIQVGYGRAKKVVKPQAGHLKGLETVKTMKEFAVREDDVKNIKRGDVITVEVFTAGDKIKVTGISKGKGFQGVVKRHGFHGQKASHGHKDQERMPGSIGAGGVQRVFKGIRMAGQMGNERVTVDGLEVVEINPEKNILYIKGAVPGARNGLVIISGEGQMNLAAKVVSEPEPIAASPVEEAKEDVAPVEAAENTEAEAPATEVENKTE